VLHATAAIATQISTARTIFVTLVFLSRLRFLPPPASTTAGSDILDQAVRGLRRTRALHGSSHASEMPPLLPEADRRVPIIGGRA
jgi:hypothetical protein